MAVGSTLKAAYQRPLSSLDTLGSQLAFYVKAIAWTPRTISRYKKEILRLLAEVTLGSGALAVIGGTVGVITMMAFFTGTEVGLQGFKGLEQIGAEAFTGLVGSFANTREVTPLIAGVAFAAQVGAGFTAELGAMRISDEIDALEVMGLDSMLYLCATRLLGMWMVLPFVYIIAVAAGKGLGDALRSMGANLIVRGGQTMNPSTEELFQATEALPVDKVIIPTLP